MPLVLDYMEIEGPINEQWPPESHRRIFFKGSEANKDDAYAREIIARFATQAFRRPVDTEEVDELMQLFRAEREQDTSFEDSIKVALSAVLCAHDFLFLVEPRTGESATPRALNDFEAVFIWAGSKSRMRNFGGSIRSTIRGGTPSTKRSST
jgi:hypothetical protein